MTLTTAATTRSEIMRAVKSRDTAPELAVRRMLHAMARGYRLHRRDIPGNPDIVYSRRKLAIFVHGCFWHGHHCKRGSRVPKANRKYWTDKIARNRARDSRTRRRLRGMGWQSVIVWECELRNPLKLKRRLLRFLS